jgi:hypothetical protein
MNYFLPKNTIPRWLAPAAILLGLVCIVVGFGLLTWSPSSAAAPNRLVVRVPPTVPKIELPTLALVLTSAPAIVLSPTPLPTPTATEPVSLVETGAVFNLTIVHSNDTWGYTQPCG